MANLPLLLPPDPQTWHPTAVGWLRVDGIHVVVSKTCSTAAVPGHGEVVTWRQDYPEPGGDVEACRDLVDEFLPLVAPPRVERLKVHPQSAQEAR